MLLLINFNGLRILLTVKEISQEVPFLLPHGSLLQYLRINLESLRYCKRLDRGSSYYEIFIKIL